MRWSLAAACVSMGLQLNPAQIELMPFSMMTAAVRVEADTTAGACDFFVTVDSGSAISPLGRSLKGPGEARWPFQVFKEVSVDRIVKPTPEVLTGEDVLEGRFQQGRGRQSREVMYTLRLESSLGLQPQGRYGENLRFSLFQGKPGEAATWVQSRSLRVVATSVATANMKPMTAGAGRTVFVQSNAGYRLRVGEKNPDTSVEINSRSPLARDVEVVLPYPSKSSGPDVETTFSLESVE